MGELLGVDGSMEFRFSHIFREGNQAADILSNVALDHDGFRWWDEAIPPIYSAVYADRIGQVQYRFC